MTTPTAVEIQRYLIGLGHDLGKNGPSGRGDDNDFGPLSRTAWDVEVAKHPMPAPKVPPYSIIDISAESKVVRSYLQRANIRAFVWHHTAGAYTAEATMAALNSQGYSVQYCMDRTGQMFAMSPHLMSAAHAGAADKSPWNTILNGVNANAYTLGCEVCAKLPGDVLDLQVASAIRFAVMLEREFPGIYHIGHGELSSRKMPDEGLRIAQAIRGINFKIKPELIKAV